MISKQVELEISDLDTYINLLKQKHSTNVIKKFRDIYGLTVHGGGQRGDKETGHVTVDSAYTKKLVKSHIQYSNVIKSLNKLFLKMKFEDPYMDEDTLE